MWSGLMDGVRYLITAHVVTDTAESVTPFVRLFSYNLTTFVATELTSKAGWAGPAGNSRFTNVANKVSFCVVRQPRRYFFGVVKPAQDMLVIQNGAEYARIYNPRFDTGGVFVDVGQAMGVQKTLTIPAIAGQFRKTYRLARFLQVANATGTGRTYSKTGNSFVMAESSVAPYNALSNFVVQMSTVNMAVGAYAATTFAASASFDGEQLVMLLQGTVTQVTNILNNIRLDISGGHTHITASGASAATPTVVTTSTAHGISAANDGTQLNSVYVHNLNGVTDGFYYAKVTGFSPTTFALYSDVAQTTGVTSTGGVGAGPYIMSTPMYAAYDPSATGNDGQKRRYDLITYDAASGRHIAVFYGLASIDPAQRTAFHIKMTRTTGTVGTTTDGPVYILMCGCASSNAFIAGSDFGIGYRDAQSGIEGPGYISSGTTGEALKNMGGPDTGLTFPDLSLIGLPLLLDYSLFLANTGPYSANSGIVTGGMDGVPTCCDIYAAYPVADPVTGAITGLGDYLWIQTQAIWIAGTSGPNKIWAADFTSSFIESKTEAWQFLSNLPARTQQDVVSPMPSSFNEGLPIGTCMAFANSRSFVGNLVEGGLLGSGGVSSPGDIAFSAQNHPFRFQTESVSDTDGGRAQVGGDTVMAIVALAAGSSSYNAIAGIALTAARVYAIGASNFYGLGRSDAWSGQFYSDATSLSRPALIGPHGTNEPGSVATYANQLFFVDQESQICEFTNSGIQSFSRNTVDDKPKAIPAARRGATCGVYFKDRYMLAYTPNGATINSHVLGWANLFRYWECDDLLYGNVNCEFMARFLDTTLPGSGQRLFMAAQTGGALYAFDEGTTEYDGSNIAVRMTTRALEFWRLFKAQIGSGAYFKFISLFSDQAAGATAQIDRYYEPHGSQYRSTQKLDNGVVSTARRLGDDTGTSVTEISATGLPEGGSIGYLDLQTSVPGGFRLNAMLAEVEPLSNIDKVGGA